MRYPATSMSIMILIVCCVILYSGFTPNPPPTYINTDVGKSHIKMANPPITPTPFEKVLEKPKTKCIVIKQHIPEPPKKTVPKWHRVEYGGRIYGVDSRGFYHSQDGKTWRPIYVDTTAYTWIDDGKNPRIGAGDGRTSTNRNAKTTYGIATGSSAVPIGSILHVSGYGEFAVDDKGGKLRTEWSKGKIRLDLRIPNRRYDGVWRSNDDIRKIAFRHGCRRNRMVLMLVK